MTEEKLYGVIVEHLRNMNRELEDLHRKCEISEWKMKRMDNEQIKYPYYRSLN